MNEKSFRILAMSSEFAAAVRSARAANAALDGHAIVRRQDGEKHQCRHCLTLSQPDETVLLASYRPFSSNQPYAERGPVWVHERECDRYSRESEYPAQFPKRSAVMRAYDSEDTMIAAEPVGDRRVQSVIQMLLADPRVAYLHARNVAEGCFMFRIER